MTYTALIGREVQANVSGPETEDARRQQAANLGETLLGRHAISGDGVGAGQGFVHGRPFAIDVDGRPVGGVT